MPGRLFCLPPRSVRFGAHIPHPSGPSSPSSRAAGGVGEALCARHQLCRQRARSLRTLQGPIFLRARCSCPR
eukprot:1103569-Rhodomonas_salina.2